MGPSFGRNLYPGVLVSSKTLEELGTLYVEKKIDTFPPTISFEKVSSIRSSHIIEDLCDVLTCRDQQYLIRNAFLYEDRFKWLFTFPDAVEIPCLYFETYTKEERSRFSITQTENVFDELMITNIFEGNSFFLILSPLSNDIDYTVAKKQLLIAFEKYFHQKQKDLLPNVYVNVWANWTECLGNDISLKTAFEIISKYDQPQITRFYWDILSNEKKDNFDKLYIKLFKQIRNICNGCMKLHKFLKLNQCTFAGEEKANWKAIFENVLGEFKKRMYFSTYYNLKILLALIPCAIKLLKHDVKISLTEMKNVSEETQNICNQMEKCVSESNRNCEENGCYLSPHSVGYKFKNTNEAKNVFGGQSILIVNPASKNFDRWLEPKFGRIACIIEQYEFGDEELMLYEQNCYYAFGEITVLEKLNQNSQNAVPKLTFRCEKDIYERYWKCKTCGYFVKRNDVELICKCGLSFMKTAKFNCPVQHANVPMKKEKLCINNGINDKSDEQKAFFQKKSKKFLENTHTILVFGHEGSGKSAVINAVINYMMFPSLKEALIKPITVPIAFMFTFNGEKHFRMERNAEKSIITSSKYPKITIIEHEYESNVYRFIDTPEISASQNFAFAIQDSLTYLHPFDGIWIVMPGNVKLNASETWLHPILKMIPKKLFPRINYVFTDIPKSGNAVDHFQTILKCLPTLKGIVPSPDNMFYVSNDSLKFLYTFKTEINNLTKVSIYEKIWAHSKSEMFRLLEKSRLSYIDDNERTKLSFLIDLQYLFNAIRGKVNNDTLMPLIQLLEKEYLFTEFNVNKFTKNSSPSYREVLQSICKIKSEIIFKYPCEILDTFIEKYNDKFTSV